MRPLIVLLLVLVALGALTFGLFELGILGSGNGGRGTAVGPSTPAPSAPAPRSGGPVDLANPDLGSSPERAGVEAPLDEGPVASVQSLGQGNLLGGRVTDESGAAVAGAVVRLSRDAMMGDALAMSFFTNRPRTRKELRETTDASGHYRFKDIAPARDYYLVVQHADFAPLQESLVYVGERGEFPGPDVVLVPGSRLYGYVRDVGGNPVPDAELHLDSAYNMAWNEPNPDRLTVESDVTGYYEFRNVPAGPRNLTVQAPGYGSQVHQGQAFKGEAGEERQLDVQLEVGHPIVGMVVGPDGVGVPGASVTAVNFQNQITSRGDTVTDELGRFQIDDLRTGSYIVMVQAKGFTQARHNRVQAGKVDVLIELTRQACVNGRVLAQGQPLQSFQIEVRRTMPNTAPDAQQVYEQTEIRDSFEEAADGRFELCGFDGGYYALLVTAPGFAPTQSESFQVLQGQNPPPVTVVLAAGGGIVGRLLDPDGAPVSGAVVSSHDNAGSGSMLDDFLGGFVMSLATERRARSDGEGYFRLAQLTPATYMLSIEHPRFTRESVRDLTVLEGQEVKVGDVTLRVGGTVRGKVTAQDGTPLLRGFVQLISTTDPAYQYKARTDSTGRYEFLHVRPGSYKLSATRDSGSDPFGAILDQQASEVTISVTDGLQVSKELTLGS